MEMAGLSPYLPSPPPLLPPPPGPRSLTSRELAQNHGKENDTCRRSRTQDWAQTPGEQGLSPYGQVSLVASLLVRESGTHTLGQEEETNYCFGHSWTDGETGRPGTHSFTSASDPPSYIPICEIGSQAHLVK